MIECGDGFNGVGCDGVFVGWVMKYGVEGVLVCMWLGVGIGGNNVDVDVVVEMDELIDECFVVEGI